VYHTDENVVVSAPTGAGKTVRPSLFLSARSQPELTPIHLQVLFELAIVRLFTSSPSNDAKVLYMVRLALSLALSHPDPL